MEKRTLKEPSDGEKKHEEWLRKKLIHLYGDRCPDYHRGCASCDAWYMYREILRDNRGELVDW